MDKAYPIIKHLTDGKKMNKKGEGNGALRIQERLRYVTIALFLINLYYN